jgi:hypothetical protein
LPRSIAKEMRTVYASNIHNFHGLAAIATFPRKLFR